MKNTLLIGKTEKLRGICEIHKLCLSAVKFDPDGTCKLFQRFARTGIFTVEEKENSCFSGTLSGIADQDTAGNTLCGTLHRVSRKI